MGYISLGNGIRIPATDDTLDRVAHLLENPPTAGGGFWLAGQLEVERDGEPTQPDPRYGHQRLWVPAGELVTLVYDRPLHPRPDRIDDDPRVVLV